jgi:hypothetical protein
MNVNGFYWALLANKLIIGTFWTDYQYLIGN